MKSASDIPGDWANWPTRLSEQIPHFNVAIVGALFVAFLIVMACLGCATPVSPRLPLPSCTTVVGTFATGQPILGDGGCLTTQQ